VSEQNIFLRVKELRGRVAVVTGAASGIGRALADRFAGEGMKVVLADVDEPALEAAVSELEASGADALGATTDVSRAEDVQVLADRTIEAFGAVHLLCNNAGVEGGAPFVDIPEKLWDWVLGVDLWGVVHGCRIFLPLLAEQDEAHIVNTASLAALSGWLPTGTPYVASKFAVLGLTENLHHELALMDSPVGVSVLCPGVVASRLPWAERNRPPEIEVDDDHPMRRGVIDGLRTIVESSDSMPADQAADAVVNAVRERRFFVLTHPDEAIAAVEARLKWMRTNEPPDLPRLRPWGEQAVQASRSS
jgi:NAD(P)-dependent dehydrogenase (short-subunit alcohol dehydrogenase family)